MNDMAEIKANADRLVELTNQQSVIKAEIDEIKAWFEKIATDDLKDAKKKTIDYWGSNNSKVVVGNSETVKPVSMTMVKKLLGDVFEEFVKEDTSYKMTDPYKEIVTFLKENGEEMSQMAICTYAKKYLATVEMITVAQSNFSMLMDEMNRYPDLDTSEALIRLASHHVMNALTNVDEEQMKEVPIEKLIKETNGLIRAAAYKKRIEVQNRDNYEAGLEAVKSLVFEAMAKENPELYRQVSAYLNKKKNEGLEG